MIIQCPACHARAKIADTQEGAKVRCGECGRIYVAGAGAGRRGASSSRSKVGLWLGLGAGGIAILFALIMVSKGKGTDYGAAGKDRDTEDPDSGPARNLMSFEHSPEIQAAVRVHEAAYLHQLARVQSALCGPKVYAWKQGLAKMAAEAEGETVEVTPEEYAEWEAEFEALQPYKKDMILAEYAEAMCTGEDRDLVADWRPYDGEIVGVDEATGATVVRLQVATRAEGSAETRNIQWGLYQVKGHWKVATWDRWYSDAEKRTTRKKRDKGYETVTLSDGSVVFEREPEPLPHLPDTPPELAEEIDKLIATMIDLDLGNEGIRARQRIVEIGRPAIPRLLTKLYELPLTTGEEAIQINTVVVALREITGQYHGYKPQEFLGSGTGTTAERRESSIKQWFAWWHRKQKTFTEKEAGTDALEELLKEDGISEDEKRWLERHQDD